jgi:hypothetical protein
MVSHPKLITHSGNSASVYGTMNYLPKPNYTPAHLKYITTIFVLNVVALKHQFILLSVKTFYPKFDNNITK